MTSIILAVRIQHIDIPVKIENAVKIKCKYTQLKGQPNSNNAQLEVGL
jgi:hypothetical protein